MLRAGRRALLLSVVIAALPFAARAVDATWNYAVQVSAVVSDSPPRITLSWVEDTTPGVGGYRPAYSVSRKPLGATEWGHPQSVPAGELTFADDDVAIGVAYEYQVIRVFHDPSAPEVDHSAYGYLVSGIAVPFPDRRGKVILAVENSVADALDDRVRRLRDDLVRDGWVTAQVNVAADAPPAQVRDLIRAEYYSDAAVADAVLLLGHVPVVKAGHFAPDGHEKRAMPCDSYYGDMDGTWTDADGDGVIDANVIASDIELEVGRVDFASLERAQTGKTEMELVARYLDKNHAYRAGQLRFVPRALVGDRVGIDRGRAPAAAGFRAFSAFFGPDQVFQADTNDDAADAQRWYSLLQAGSYAWAFGSGAGAYELAAFLGTDGEYKSVTSANLAADAKAAFYLMFGSHFLEWDHSDNLLRSALAAPEGGLGAGWSGRPSLFMHFMGLGETVGYGVRVSQNNDGLYFSPTNAFRRGVHVAWMGDPTLRLQYLAPPSGLDGTREVDALRLSWSASPDARDGAVTYVVYRGASTTGPFTRLTPSPIDATTFVDLSPVGNATYLVRAVALRQTASGTYQDASQGVTWTRPGNDPGPSAAPLAQPKVLLPLLFTPVPGKEQPGPRP